MSDLTVHQTATPLGPFSVLADGNVVHAAGFTTSVRRSRSMRPMRPNKRSCRGRTTGKSPYMAGKS